MARLFPIILLRGPIVVGMPLHAISTKNAEVECDIRMNFALLLTMCAFERVISTEANVG